ncbi:hypothetical protein PMZ80_007612 [Knufia obscura]|uniref:Uncharacterized protein n=2 Tax=Knufia TaxID=430999 RepID=A0AAN8I9C9_9EURO|nr:hypothetical protein PMZ80_007612 [Knufia obscura]KAK5954155.1 hypothetical protein OHC33_004727 [Knufia fluminis]
MADGIRAKAEAFCQSYAQAVNCTDPTKTEEAAKAILSHYVPKGFVSFSMGSINPLGDHDKAASGAKPYLDRWFTLGIGLDVTLESSRIEVVSPYNALCFLTWKAHPFPQCGEKEWTFENVYSYRLLPGQEDSRGAFEFAISDNEISALLQRFPDFMNMAK